MKKINLLFMAIVAISITACGPPKLEQFAEINTNETAFLVPLETAATKDAQSQFMSADYLNQNKVAAKRVILPLRKKMTGRMWFSYEWIPTMRVVKVNRQPVTREWVATEGKGTTNTDEAISVESAESIGFDLGVNVTTMIEEPDAATFQYYYTGKTLDQVTDENVRGYLTQVLSEAFGQLEMDECKAQKIEIFRSAKDSATEHFKKFGVTIAALGLAEGLTYDDPEIQKAINDFNTAQMDIKIAGQEREAQEVRNQMNVEIATAEREAAEEFQKAAAAQSQRMLLEAQIKAVEKWDGKMPLYITSNGNSANLPFIPAPMPQPAKATASPPAQPQP